MTTETPFRIPTDQELSWLKRLLDADFPGKYELAVMLTDCEVKILDEYGSLEIRPNVDGNAPVVKSVPVEAEATDTDGMTIHLLLHVFQGRPKELDIYKDDGSLIKSIPPASSFEVIVLPPHPL
jgi:hypothetical protein